jgi:hypothetical protein
LTIPVSNSKLAVIGVYRRPSAANLVLDLICVYLRFHSGFLGALGGSIIVVGSLGVYRRPSAAQKP